MFQILSTHVKVNFFSFKIEEDYTFTTFVDQKQRLSVFSISMYDRLIWLAFLDFSKLLKKYWTAGRVVF